MASTLNSFTDITCPSACSTDLNLVAIASDQTCVKVPFKSQVSRLYIRPDGAADPFTYPGGDGGADPTLTASALDNTTSDNSTTKYLVGKGGVAEPEEDIYEGAEGKHIIDKRRYRLEFEVNVRELAVRNLIRQLQCGWLSFTFRYGTRGGQLFGGDSEIIPVFVNGQLPLDAADDGREIGRIIIEYETDNGDPPRHANPHA